MNLIRQYRLANKAYQGLFLNNNYTTIRNLAKFKVKTLRQIADLRNIDATDLSKQDIIISLLKSQPNIKESQYLSLLNEKPSNEIDNKINEIKIMLIEYDNKLTNREITKFKKDLYDIKKMINSSHDIRTTHYQSISNDLKKIFNPVITNRKIKKTNLNAITNHLNKLIREIKFLRKDRIISHDDKYYTGLKDLEYTFGDIDDYYKPILAKQSFYDENTHIFNHQVYVCRGISDNSMSVESYLDKVQPHLVQLIKEKQTNSQKIQIVICVKFIYPTTKKEFTNYMQTDNLRVIPTDDEYTVLNKLLHNFLTKYQ